MRASLPTSRPVSGKNWPSRDDGTNWTAQTYTQSHGEDLYRRTMYTFWKRTSPPPDTRHVRRARPRDLHRPPLDDEHAAPGAGPAERPDLCRGLAQVGRANHDRRRRWRPTSGSPLPSASRRRASRRPRRQAVLRRVFEQELAAFGANAAAAEKLLPSANPSQRKARRRRTGRLDHRGQHDPQSRRDRDEGIGTMNHESRTPTASDAPPVLRPYGHGHRDGRLGVALEPRAIRRPASTGLATQRDVAGSAFCPRRSR